MRLDINHCATLEDQVKRTFLDDLFHSAVQFRLELLQHFTVGNGFGFVQLLGLELEVTGLLLELKL